MFTISRTTPAYYLTTVTKDRLPIFRTDELKEILAQALAEARISGGIRIFAYVIMPDHSHLLTDGAKPISEVLRYLNGISARRVIDHLKANGHQASLWKLRSATKSRGYKYSVWQHHADAFNVIGEDTFMQKAQYIHENPVRAGFVSRAEDYVYSSARLWMKKSLENEPLRMDLDEINWRAAA